MSQSYDALQRVTNASAKEGSTALFSQTRTYDNDGNVLGQATSAISSSGSAMSENEAFCYDASLGLSGLGIPGPQPAAITV